MSDFKQTETRIVNLYALRDIIYEAIQANTDIDSAVSQFGLTYIDQEAHQSIENAHVELYWRNEYLETLKPSFPPKYSHRVGAFYIDENASGVWMEAKYLGVRVDYELRGNTVKCHPVEDETAKTTRLGELIMAGQIKRDGEAGIG